MSSYQRSTQHPLDLHFERAEWLDDYFGQHNYGVRFPSDGKVFRADEFDWEERPEHAGALVPTFIFKSEMTIEQTEKGSRWGKTHAEPEISVEEHADGKKTTITKHEGGQQDVTIEVTRLDIENRTPEDTKAEGVILNRLSKEKVGVLVIHKPTNDNVYFTCSLTEVRKNAEMVIGKWCEAHPETRATFADFVLIESAVVTQKPKVTTL